MNPIEKSLKWLGIAIAALLGIFALVALTGIILDQLANPELVRIQEEALGYFENFRSRGFQKPISEERGNAWDFYSEAADMLDLTDQEWTALRDHFDRKQWAPEEWLPILSRHENALMGIERGVRQSTCLIPYEYEKGPTVPLPYSRSTRAVAMLLLLRGDLRLDVEDCGTALSDYITAVRYARDIAGGFPVRAGRRMGVSILTLALDRIEAVLKTRCLSPEDLRSLAQTLQTTQRSWPRPSEAIRAEGHYYASGLQYGHFHPTFVLIKVDMAKPSSSPTRRFQLFQFLRHFFSRNRAFVQFARAHQHMTGDIAGAESKPWAEVEPVLSRWAQRMKRYWFILGDYEKPMRSHFESITRMRLLGVAALLQAHCEERGAYPAELGSVKEQRFETLFVDPIAASPWNHRISAYGDSAIIYSAGFDLKDDGGKPVEAPDFKGDIAISLFTPVERPEEPTDTEDEAPDL